MSFLGVVVFVSACGSSDAKRRVIAEDGDDAGGSGGSATSGKDAGEVSPPDASADASPDPGDAGPDASADPGDAGPDASADSGDAGPDAGDAALPVRCGSLSTMCILAGDFSDGNARDGVGTDARLGFPEGLVSDAAGNVYVAESNSGLVAKVTPAGVVTKLFDHPFATMLALAPGGTLYSVQASTNCQHRRLAPPLVPGATPEDWTCGPNPTAAGDARGLAVSAGGVVHIALREGNSIVQIGALSGGTYPVSVFAGALNRFAAPGASDGTGTAAQFNEPRGIAFDASGDLFVADSGNHTIRRVTSAGVVTTFAGAAGQRGSVDGTRGAARFDNPTDLSIDENGDLVVLERGDPANNPVARVRRITSAGVVTTLFNATAEAIAIASPAAVGFASNIRGITAITAHRIALSAGNAIVVRNLP